MAVQRPALEAVLKQLGHQRLGLRQRHQAVPNVAGRQNAQLAPQPAGTSAIVEHRDHSRKVVGKFLQPAQQRGETRAAADDDDAGATATLALLGEDIDQLVLAGRKEGTGDGADRSLQAGEHGQQPASNECHPEPTW